MSTFRYFRDSSGLITRVLAGAAGDVLLTLENGDKIIPVDLDVDGTRQEAKANGESFRFEEVTYTEFDEVIPDEWVQANKVIDPVHGELDDKGEPVNA